MKIALLGDTALYGKFSLENKKLLESIKSVADFLKDFDYVVLNLETPFAENKAKKNGSKSAYIKSDPANIEILKYLHVNAVNLANNHIFDYGINSYQLTKEILSNHDILYFGTENKQLKINIENNKIAFSGFCCYSTNPLNMKIDGVNPLNYEEVKKTLLLNVEEEYNNIVSIHAGQEHVNFPNYDHILFARKLSEVCPYIFYGHHPHVLQGIEEINGSLIAYSLGNFCFDNVFTSKSKLPLVEMSENNKSSIILSLEYKDNKLIAYSITPIFDAQLCTDKQSNIILKQLSNYSEVLKLPKEEYIYKRSMLLNECLTSRKHKRNLEWYFKRINLNSIKMLLNAKRNKSAYIKNVKKYVGE